MIRPRRPSPDIRRRHRRIPILWPGSLEHGGEGSDCAILNISGGGAKLRMTEARPCAGEVSLTSPRFGALRGRVVWRDRSYLGLAFVDQPLRVAETLGPALF